MTDLAEKSCGPCAEGDDPMDKHEIEEHLEKLDGPWEAEENHHLVREFTFENFLEALDFTNTIGEIAEEEFHHPNIYLTWGKVRTKIWTHEMDGLSEADFVLAAKFERAYREEFAD